MRKKRKVMYVVHRLDEIPQFASGIEEAAYWGNHMLSKNLALRLPPDGGPLPPVREPTSCDERRYAVRHRGR